MISRHFWTNLKGLSCALLLLFGTFSLLTLSVVVGLYSRYQSSVWPCLLVLSVCLIGLLSWIQLTAMKAEQRLDGEGSVRNFVSTIPTITGLLTARGSLTCPPPPPYSDASLYQVFKPAVCEECSTDGGSAPPPSYDEAIKSAQTLTQKLGDQNNPSSRTCGNPIDMV